MVLGDSIVDDAPGAGVGGYYRAGGELLRSFGVDVLEIVGVGGSTMGQWLYNAGHTKGPGRGPGRWKNGKRILTPAQRKAADLGRLAALEPDVVWVNFGTNDAHHGLTPAQMVINAKAIIELFPKARIIWSIGNVEDDASHRRVKEQFAVALRRATSSRVLVLDTIGSTGRPYIGKGLHPSVSAHRAYLQPLADGIAAHIAASTPSSPVGSKIIAGAAAAALVLLVAAVVKGAK